MPVNSGWANNCGKELFTLGWVQCATPQKITKPEIPINVVSGVDKVVLQLNQPLQEKYRKTIIENEDEAAIALVMLMVESGLIQ